MTGGNGDKTVTEIKSKWRNGDSDETERQRCGETGIVTKRGQIRNGVNFSGLPVRTSLIYKHNLQS